MATNNKFLASPGLVTEKYTAWEKEMKFWEMATNVDIKKRGSSSSCHFSFRINIKNVKKHRHHLVMLIT